jgi:hypothetical protein
MYFVTPDQIYKKLEGVGHCQPSLDITIPTIWMLGKTILELGILGLPRASYSSRCSLKQYNNSFAHA